MFRRLWKSWVRWNIVPAISALVTIPMGIWLAGVVEQQLPKTWSEEMCKSVYCAVVIGVAVMGFVALQYLALNRRRP